MKLFLITKEDWRDASPVVRLFNVIFDVANLLVVVVAILALADWVGL